MPAPMPHRRLEVVVLAARGLGDLKEDSRCKRMVELSILSHTDPQGDEFIKKKSPWSLIPPGKGCESLCFGRSGLRSMFPLEGPNASALVETRRFLESAELRVRLLVSGLSTQSSSVVMLQSLLPVSMANGLTKELDKATAQIEAETRIPLADIIKGTEDAHHSGWMNLQRCLTTGSSVDFVTPQVWMQVYVLPDYEKIVSTLNVEYEAEGSKLPDFRATLCNWRPAEPATEAQTAPAEASEVTPPPAETQSQAAAPPPPQGQAPASGSEAPAPLAVVVPPGVGPGQMFPVQGPPTEHLVKCPPGLKPGDTWKAASPSGQPIQVVIPADVQEGQQFKVRIPQMLQVQCPPDSGPGATLHLNIQQAASNVMQVQCPRDTNPGDKITVVVPGTGHSMVVEIPPGVCPGQPFAVQAPPPMPLVQIPPQFLPPPRPLVPAITATLVPHPSNSSPDGCAGAHTPPEEESRATPDLLSGESPSKPNISACGEPKADGPADLNVLGDVLSAAAAEESVGAGNEAPSIDMASPPIVDLVALYAQASPPAAEVETVSAQTSLPSAAGGAEASDKFAALMALDGVPESPQRPPPLAPEEVPGASEPKESFHALQDSLLTGFSDSFKPPD